MYFRRPSVEMIRIKALHHGDIENAQSGLLWSPLIYFGTPNYPYDFEFETFHPKFETVHRD